MSKISLSRLLQEANEQSIPRQKHIKKKQELEKVIVETQGKYKDTIFGNDTPICKESLNELKKRKIDDERLHSQKLTENTERKLASGWWHDDTQKRQLRF